MSRVWVGDPYELGGEFNSDTPSMARARKVRQALSWAIDRESLNESLLAGLGQVGYLPMCREGMACYKQPPYDIEGAHRLLEEAGYANGFDFEFWCEPGGLECDLYEALAGIWKAEFNIDATIAKTEYGVHREKIITKTEKTPRSCGADVNMVPLTWPKDIVFCSASATGLGCGIEYREIGLNYLNALKETNQAKLIEYAMTFFKLLEDQALTTGVVNTPEAPIYNPDMIKAWELTPEGKGNMGGFNSPWTIQLK